VDAFIPSPSSNGVHVGPLFVHAYGLAYVAAVLAAVAITSRRWRAVGGDPKLVHEVAWWAFPAGLIGGRLYFLATSWDEVPDHWWGPLAVWQGGLGIWGGIAAGTLVGIWVLHRRKANIPLFLDAAAPALLVAQAIGRVGNYFNQELFGGPTTLPWGLEIDPAHRPARYAEFATFHPTFLYEIVWNLLLAFALVQLGRRRAIRPPGLFALYVAGYSLGRIGEELLRVDPAHHILGLRLNFFVAALLFVAGAIWFVASQTATSLPRRHGASLLAVGAALCVCGCGHSGPRVTAMALASVCRTAGVGDPHSPARADLGLCEASSAHIRRNVMNTANTPREQVERVLDRYDRQRRLGFPPSDAVGATAQHLRVPRETVMKALAVREARQRPLRLVA
jgi:prolipoprotein diacylglyceryl transferase